MIRGLLPKITDQIEFYKESQTVCYVNVYNYQIFRKYPELVQRIDCFTLDGIALAKFLRVFANKRIKRKSPDFSSYFKEYFDYLNTNHKRVFFLGGSDEDIESFVLLVGTEYPRIKIVGYRSGFQLDESRIIEQLIIEKVDSLIVGMGSPKQELFILKAKDKGFKGSCFSCGAFFSQTACKGIAYYPSLITKLHLRWIYRIYQEPKLFKRYFVQYPIGILYLLRDKYST